MSQPLNKQQLLEHIGTTLTKTKVDKLSAILRESNFYLPDLIDLSFHTDKQSAFRAAWLLENVYLKKPMAYLSDLKDLINSFSKITNPSCARHYAKIAMHITSPKAPPGIKEIIAVTDMEPVTDKCFSWMIDPKTLVAVKVFAAEALFNLSPRYPWIKEELKEQLIYLMKDGSAAMQHRAKKLLPKLAAEI